MLTTGRPNLANRERFVERVNQILDTKIFTNNGPFVQELEELVCSELQVDHCIAVANATLALELIFEAMGVQGEVIIPSFSFVATAQALIRCNIKPVFCDIDPKREACMSPPAARNLVTEKTAAIMPVNVYGFACDLQAFAEISQERNIPLIYDSAHGLGVKYLDKMMGGFGLAEVFSLHATKFVTGFEGGLITTNDEKLADKLKLRRNFGFSDYDKVIACGTNAKLSEIHAAMALTNFEMIEELTDLNKRNYLLYESLLNKNARLIAPSLDTVSNYQYIPIRVQADIRDRLVNLLIERDVFARRYFYPGIHRFEVFQEYYRDLPETDKLCSEVICLPTGQDVQKQDIENICQIINKFTNENTPVPEPQYLA